MTLNQTQIDTQIQNLQDGVDVVWILTSAALVVIMQVGFAYVEAGNVRVKNVRSILLKNTVDYVLGGLIFTFVASGIARGKSVGGFIGTDGFGGVKPEWETSSDAYYNAVTLYSALFACTTSTIISGAIAERMRLSAYMLLSTLSPFLLYSLPAHWVWNPEGFLNNSEVPYMQVSDFAGGAVVHVTGGVAAYVAAWFVGPRIGRFNTKTGKLKDIDGHSVVLGGLGTWLILFGWLGFNAGSSLGVSTEAGAKSAAVAALNTFLAVVTGALVSIMYHTLILGKINLGEMYNNMLAGAAAITAGCGFVSPIYAVVMGLCGSVAYVIAGPIVAKKCRIDDPLSAISVHFAAATTGFLLIGFFHETDGMIATGHGYKLASQVIGLLVIMFNSIFWTGGSMFLFTLIIGPVRVEEKIEILGCDIELDGIAAYESTEGNSHIAYAVLRQDEVLNGQFNDFLKSIFCFHNISFLTAVEDFEKGLNDPSVDSAAEAQSIYDNFICPDGSDPISLPDWQVGQVKRNVNEGTAALKEIFSPPKQEIYTLLDTTIGTHFCHTPDYQRFIKSNKKPKSVAPLHFLTKSWIFRAAKPMKYGRAKPSFDPFKKFKHTESIEDSDDSDDEAMLSSVAGNAVAPEGGSDDEDDE